MTGRRVRLGLLGAGLLGACILAACGGGSSNPNAVSIGCPLPTGLQITLVYPANGATSVPTALPQVVLAVSSPLPASFQADLLETSSDLLTFGTLEASPSPLPSPLATAGFANPIYQQYSYSTGTGSTFMVDAGTVYAVLLSENGCAPPFPQIGAFTTHQ